MNIKSFKSLFLLASIIVAFSSCVDSISLIKRRYNRGFYLAQRSSGKSKEKELPKQKTIHGAVAIQCEDKLGILIEPVISNSVSEGILPGGGSFSKISNSNIIASAAASPIVVTSLKRQPVKIRPIVTPDKANKTPSKVLLAFLSLFPILCLIAVYLHDQKVVSMNFWITLLLHFTVIGYVIFSLLVVFNVVDLR